MVRCRERHRLPDDPARTRRVHLIEGDTLGGASRRVNVTSCAAGASVAELLRITALETAAQPFDAPLEEPCVKDSGTT